MGKRGPKPEPTAKLAGKGSWRAKVRTGEPKVDPGYPVCPAWMQGEARVTWDRIVPELVNLGIMTKLDGPAFSRYCVYSVLWLKELNHPARSESTLDRYANQLMRLEGSFGLTPSARSGLNVSKDDKKDKGYWRGAG